MGCRWHRFGNLPYVISKRKLSVDPAAMHSQLNFMNEDVCILVDKLDNPVGRATKKECHTWSNIETGGMLHRAFSIFVFNQRNELLLQKRSKFKLTFPGLWSNTCCSHPLYNLNEHEENVFPTYLGTRKAAQRKMCHEFGIEPQEIPINDIKFIHRILYKARSGLQSAWGEHELDYILFAKADLNTDRLNKDEVEEAIYVSRKQLSDILAANMASKPTEYKLTPWLTLIAQQSLLNDLWLRLDRIDEMADDNIFECDHS